MMHNTNDLTGQRFGKLVAMRPTNERRSGSVVWECECDCGGKTFASAQNLLKGDKKSCGCLREETLVGYQFGEFRVESFAYTKWRHKFWNCKCSCGNFVQMDTYHIHKGDKLNCHGPAHINPLTIDLAGKRFGKLTVIEKLHEKDKHGRLLWRCRCDCGNEKTVMGAYLRNGDVNSCGCMPSKGEYLVEQYLKESGIKYKRQYTFSDLLGDSGYLRFDFAIFDNDKLCGLIEVQGAQHWLTSNDWHTDKLERYDVKKREYCSNNNIPLLAVKWDKEKINIRAVSFFCSSVLAINTKHEECA